MEGDAFGAALLQHFVDRTEAREGPASELTEVRLDDGNGPAKPENSPLIEKRGLGPAEACSDPSAPRPCEKESVM